MTQLRIATSAHLPEPDPDEGPLLDALRAAHIDAHMVAWDDPSAPWSEPIPTLLRSTWTYPQDPDAFCAWAHAVAAVAPLWNPLPVITWNLHKGYLLALAAAGVPVTPTRLVRRGDPTTCAQAIADTPGWSEVVIKPAISAGSYKTRRLQAASPEADDHLRALLSTGDALIQPYLPSVEGYGERALVVIDGHLSHAVRKSPRFAGQDESTTPTPIAPDERALASHILAVLPSLIPQSTTWPLLYARVDIARSPDGSPVLMELELIEPSLFLLTHPDAMPRFVEAIRRALTHARR